MAHVLVIAAAVLSLQVLGAAAWWCWIWARAARPRPPALLPAPRERTPPDLALRRATSPSPRKLAVMLVHGFMGFGSLGLGRARIHYFRRVARHLERRGVEVHVARLPPLGSTPDRAQALEQQLARIHCDDIVIFAHSLGGLDARWTLARGTLGSTRHRTGSEEAAQLRRVRALVTIGTPHRGSPIADAFARGAGARLRRALGRMGVVSDAVDWLTTERLARFNDEIADVPGVRYACVVGATADRRKVHPLLRVTHAFLKSHGPNDGLVTAASQTWGEVITHAEIDHWAQVGWAGSHDAAALVERVLEHLGALPQREAPPPTPKQLPASTALVVRRAATAS